MSNGCRGFQQGRRRLASTRPASSHLEPALLSSAVRPGPLHFTLALFTAAWGCRGAVRSGGSTTHLADCIALAIVHTWLLAGSSSTKADRRAARVAPPGAIGPRVARGRSDGAFGPSLGKMLGAWGAAWWDAGVDPSTPPSATAAGLCPYPSSNNIAEFFGFRALLRRALHKRPTRVIFELDSLLVVKMMLGQWGCHRAHLRKLLAECHDLSVQLTQAGCKWHIRHIYREYNTIADHLAGICLDNHANVHNWPIDPPDTASDSEWTESTNAYGSEPSCESTSSEE